MTAHVITDAQSHKPNCLWHSDWHACNCGAFDPPWMSQHQVCEWLLNNDCKEYHDRTKDPGVRCFYSKRLVDVPSCTCNDRPPSLHIFVYPDIRLHSGERFPGGVEFEVCGEANSRWLKAVIHSVKRHEVESALPKMTETMRVVWSAFVASINDG